MWALATLLLSCLVLRSDAVDCSTAAAVVAGKDLSGKLVVITGADTGIGLETTRALASVQAGIVLAVYDETHGQTVRDAIAQETGNDNLFVLPIDLSSFASVRAFAQRVLTEHNNTVDVLINDAGIELSPEGLPPITEDGFDRVVQVNYLGHYLLTSLLLPALRNAPGKGKVVHVSSAAAWSACVWAARDSDCLDTHMLETDVTTAPKGNNSEGVPASNYGISKFMQIFHARQLAEYDDALAYSLHPGLVATAMTDALPADVLASWCAPLPVKPGVCPLNATQGAATSAFVAVTDFPSTQDGAFFNQCAEQAPPTWTAEEQEQLFFMSKTWTGVNGASATVQMK